MLRLVGFDFFGWARREELTEQRPSELGVSKMEHDRENHCWKDHANQNRGNDVVPPEELEGEKKVDRLLEQPIRKRREILDDEEANGNSKNVKELQDVSLKYSVRENDVSERKHDVVGNDVHLIVGESSDAGDPLQQGIDDLEGCLHFVANDPSSGNPWGLTGTRY